MIPNILAIALASYQPAGFIHPDDLLPGDLVPVDGDLNIVDIVVVLETCPKFNLRFRPVRFSDNPHYARDMDRTFNIRAFRWRRHGQRDMLGRDLTQLAYLAGAAA